VSGALTCWKDIANHLGKGIRTVQRYEREAGLPVHRPNSRNQGIVFAWPDELDAWVSRQSPQPIDGPTKVLQLENEIARLKAENEFLRHEMRHRALDGLDGDGSLARRCVDLLRANESIRRQAANAVTASRTLRFLRHATVPTGDTQRSLHLPAQRPVN
jgi:hypothetical protein